MGPITQVVDFKQNTIVAALTWEGKMEIWSSAQNDYQEIIESRMYRSFLSFSRSQRSFDIQVRTNAIAKNQDLIKLIDNELLN